MMQLRTPLALLVVVILVPACSILNKPVVSDIDIPLMSSDRTLRATIRRTTGGVPHIRGDDLASAAFGVGFTQAQDNVCLIAEAIVKARGERALFFGPGKGSANIISDFSYRALALGDNFAETNLSTAGRVLLDGFAEGYNRYIADTRPDQLPPACRNQPWVRTISSADLYAYYRIIAQFASGEFFAYGAILSAVPPGVSAEPVVVSNKEPASAGTTAKHSAVAGEAVIPKTHPASNAISPTSIAADFIKAASAKSVKFDTGLASNAWGIGKEMSEQGRGALLANPHFPYSGPRRFYQMHLTVPGYYDVNGVGMIGIPILQIGFNQNIAWSHTLSTSRRFTVYELTLVETEVPSYVKDGVVVPFTTEKIRIEVANGSGEPTILERDIYFSEYGPMIAANLITQGALPTWGKNNTAYTFRDASASAVPILDTWIGIGQASNLEEFQAVIKDCGSTLWTNTVYADDAGNAFYVDSSSVPHLSDGALEALDAKLSASNTLTQLFNNGLTLLDGSTSRDDWVEGNCGGLVPYADKPKLARTDFVQNSNSSHWPANPAEPLTGYSALFGDELSPVNARTQLGLRMLQAPTEPGFAATAPAGQDGRFSARELLDVIWNNRALYSELWLPELRERCNAIGGATVSLPGGNDRTVDSGCSVLASWDGTYNLDSTGAHLFRVFLAQLFAREDLALERSFDPANPANSSYVFTDEGRGSADDQLLQSLANALDVLDMSGIAYDTELGSVQTWTPSGGVPPVGIDSSAEPVLLSEPIPWHGGHGNLDGTLNVVEVTTHALADDTRFPRVAGAVRPNTGGLSELRGKGWAIGQGTSWHFGLEFTDSGPEAYGLLSYSQSTDLRSDYFIDQSLAYSAKIPRQLLYEEADIVANMLPDGERVLTGKLRRD